MKPSLFEEDQTHKVVTIVPPHLLVYPHHIDESKAYKKIKLFVKYSLM
jgi:hypothetical protein